ncbi:MAG: ribosomal protein S18-alanine N-acetyltransferase [Actinobacteria bacterium]|nr:ribosomal protein S18-alanine N-acetyltransferase [Actinomycetota bacterium]
MAARLFEIDPNRLEVHVVPMRRRHLRSVLRIEAQVYPRPWSLSLFLSELALRTSRCYVVARVDATVVGYAGMMFACDDAHVTTIAVDPAWRRSKIGTRLLSTLAREAIRAGMRNLTLEVRVSNRGAQAMYEKFGFAPAGIRRNYYVESNEDALVMWAERIDEPPYGGKLAAIEATIPGSTVWAEGMA